MLFRKWEALHRNKKHPPNTLVGHPTPNSFGDLLFMPRAHARGILLIIKEHQHARHEQANVVH